MKQKSAKHCSICKYGGGKAPTDIEKGALETHKAKNYTDEAKHSAEESKVVLLKKEKDSEEAIATFKLEAEQAKAILRKHIEAAKKLN